MADPLTFIPLMRSEIVQMLTQFEKVEGMVRFANDMGWDSSTWTAMITSGDMTDAQFTGAMQSISTLLTAFGSERVSLEFLKA